jgi:hypothetical protein
MAKLKTYGERKDITVETRQYALYMASTICLSLVKDCPQALALANQAIALAPDGELVDESIRPAILRIERKMKDSPVPRKAPAKP